MAWIAVSDAMFCPELRDLAKRIGCSQNEAVGILVRLWLWGINNAGEAGDLPHTTQDDIAEVVSAGLGRKFSADKIVKALISSSWICEDDGMLYLCNWQEWQHQHYKTIKTKAADAERKRNQRARRNSTAQKEVPLVHEEEVLPATPSADTGEQPEHPEEDDRSVEQAPVAEQPEEPAKKEAEPSPYEADFEVFWSLYPRKTEKRAAANCYAARIRAGWSPDDLLVACKNYGYMCKRNGTEKKYIKHAKTFLSVNEPFLDYLPSERRRSDAMDDPNDPGYCGQFGGQCGNDTKVSLEDNPYGDWR